jgi:hypothetical protein
VSRFIRNIRIRRALAANEPLRDRHKGGRCFVIGNGPSLKKQDLAPLKNETVFVCNFFNLHPQCAEIAPRYFCFADPNSFVAGTYSSDLEIDRTRWFTDIAKAVPRAEFVLPLESKELIEEKKWFDGHERWFIATEGSATEMGRAGSDLTRSIPGGAGTVAAAAVPAALFMGFKEIYLLGCDCNWFVEHLFKEDFDAEYQHFYGANPYLKRECTLRDFGLEEEFSAIGRHFKSFRMLREHAAEKGAKILNASAGGLLDVFPRVKFESLFEARAVA